MKDSSPTHISAARPRDLLLDMLRAISIVRVVLIHIVNFGRFPWWPAPTFIAPGMPVIFFVSGGLARQSLGRRNGVRRRTTDYWRKTYRRLLLPYWAFYAVVAGVAVVGSLVNDGDGWTVSTRSLLLGFSGLSIPMPSSVAREYTGHLWFMSVFLVLTALVPALVRLYERTRAGLLVGVVGIFAAVQYAEDIRGVRIPDELDHLSMFAVMYCLGFLYTDGTLHGWTARTYATLAGIMAVAAYWFDGIQPGSVNRSEIKHLVVGLAWLALALAAGGAIARFGDRHRRLLELVTRRTFTAYLWGWPTTRLAARFARTHLGDGWDYRLGMALGSFVLLVVAIRLFGGVEDLAAGRRRPTATTVESGGDPALAVVRA